MFRALGTSVPNATTSDTPARLNAPISAALTRRVDESELPPVDLAIDPSGIFSTSVGSSSKKTLASWHVTSPDEIVDAILEIAATDGADEDTQNKSHL